MRLKTTLGSNTHTQTHLLTQAKEPFFPLPWTYVLVGLGALNSSLHFVDGWWIAAVLCAITVAAYLHYVTTVIVQVCVRVCVFSGVYVCV